MTVDVDKEWSITVLKEIQTNRNSWMAEGIIFKRETPEVIVATVPGHGTTRHKAINDAIENAKDKIFEIKHGFSHPTL